MSYVVLARKYRPRRFDEMVGQGHVVQALGNALAQQGAFESAIDAYDQVLELNPDHADAAYNRDLSQRRANRVLQHLQDRGVVLQALVARGYGEDQPIADNGTAAGRAKNRRVELKRLDD